jgi:transposase
MKEITTLAIDLAKRVFQLHGVDAHGVAVLQRRVSRAQLLATIMQIPRCRVVMEACGGAHHWAREFRALGHEIHLIAGHHVKAFSRGQKNDRNDAQAIACAARQPDLPRVAIKSEEQQAVLALHRIRERLVKERIQLTNQLHGLLGEFGIVLPRGIAGLRQTMAGLLGEARVPQLLRAPLADQLEHLSQIEQRLKTLTTNIEALAKASESCQRLMRHRGVGPIISTAFVGEIADPSVFKNGRHASAWLGLVPRQHSSGDRERLLGITKRGNTYLRKLLIQGARSALLTAARHEDAVSRWSLAVQERRGGNRAAVALANKMARRLWATLRYDAYVLPANA